jgi:ankyrin repeat protein
MLLEAGADINAPSVSQNTPLHFAARNSNTDIVAALLEAGADVNRADSFNITPLHFACRCSDSYVGTALLLIRNGAAVNVRTQGGHTPLDSAILYSRHRLVPILLRAGAVLPAESDDAYILKVIAAGGFRQYERNHLNALVATFAPKFAHRATWGPPLVLHAIDAWAMTKAVMWLRRLPPEMVRRVVEYAFHLGNY